MNKCFNIIARQCMFNALQNAKNIIGYKYVLYICKFGFNLLDKDKQILFTAFQTCMFIY